ncbi:MAG: BspA family leucine-rich repeat surface protein [Defluviitaleaceae bacterium]|nr:BspA family leucine-rich repeat surface protein [Defluviitaleaceae bacterium]MCL2274513.1 BspA family leucine-rich repeat surface protein [Defluviitaleaceae bacterium]
MKKMLHKCLAWVLVWVMSIGVVGVWDAREVLANPAPVGQRVISAGSSHTMMIDVDGSLWGWGCNSLGSIGDGTNIDRHMPIRIGVDNDWAKVSAGRHRYTMAIKNDGTLWGWGQNNEGQLGDGSTTTRHTPVQIGTCAGWVNVSAGNSHTVAVKNDGTLWSWGVNSNGQLGDGTTVNRNMPVQVGVDTDWAEVSAGFSFTIAIRTDGTLWAWGANSSGQLGDGTLLSSHVPMQIGASNEWKSASAGGHHTVAIRTDGTLWAWGANSSGQLGDGTAISNQLPQQIGIENDWISVSTGQFHTVAIKNNGTLWVWGANLSGQLGDGTLLSSYVPVQINASNDWQSVSTSQFHTVAVEDNGALWAWGLNTSSQLGNGTTTDSNIPIQIIPAIATVNTLTLNNNPSGVVVGQIGAGQHAIGATVTINAGTRTGYTFTGWTVNTGSVTLANASSAITIFTMPNNAVTLTANWTPTGGSTPTCGCASGTCTVAHYSTTTFGAGGAPWRLYDCGTLVVDSGVINWTGTQSPWFSHRSDILRIIFTGPIDAGTSLRRLFMDLPNVTVINRLDYFNTGAVMDMHGTFAATRGLTSLDVSDWDTSNVTNMNSMFFHASGLTSLDLSDWNTENVTDMSEMFSDTSSLANLDVSGWDTSNVTNMSSMFSRASGLTSLNLSNWNTENVTDMNRMFGDASSLASLDVSGWDTSNVTNMQNMFNGASNLSSLDISNWDTNNVLNMSLMFQGASGLTSLDLSSWDTSNVVGMLEMFANASGLASLDLSAWNTANVMSMSFIFANTNNLRRITFGEHFRFVGLGSPLLPSITPTAQYTGYWQNVGAGTPENPQGAHVFTSDQLVAFYTTPGFADTWVWQRTGGGVTPIDITATIYNACPNWYTAVRALPSVPASPAPILCTHVEGVTNLQLSNHGLTGLSGIEYFASLTSLNVENNQLTSLDVSNNANLLFLDVRRNNMNILDDVVGWSVLFSNEYDNIRMSSMPPPSPPQLGFGFTPQTPHTLTVYGSQRPPQYTISTPVRPLPPWSGAGRYAAGDVVNINAGTRTGYTFSGWTVNAGDITLADPAAPSTTFVMPPNPVTLTANWTFIDVDPSADVSPSFTCPQFLSAVRGLPGVPNTGPILPIHVAGVTVLPFSGRGITSLAGIHHFTALTELRVSDNSLTTLDLSNNHALTTLWVNNNQLTTLNLTGNPALVEVRAENNRLEMLDVSASHALQRLRVGFNQLTQLNVTNNAALTELHAYNNLLTSLNVSQNLMLQNLRLEFNRLTALNVSQNTQLRTLWVTANQLTALDVSNNPILVSIQADANMLSELQLHNNPELEELWLYNNSFLTLDVSNNHALRDLDVTQNFMTDPNDVVGWRNHFQQYDAVIGGRSFWFFPQAIGRLTVIGSQLAPGVGTSYSGAGTHAMGTVVTIRAGTRAGYNFAGWTASHANIFFANANAATTTFFMDGRPITVTANWVRATDPPIITPVAFPVSIANSFASHSGAGTFNAGDIVTINAGTRNNYNFAGWSIDMGNISLFNAISSTTSFIMPNHAVAIIAHWTRAQTIWDDWALWYYWLLWQPFPPAQPAPPVAVDGTPPADFTPPPVFAPQPATPRLGEIAGVHNTASAVTAVENAVMRFQAMTPWQQAQLPPNYLENFAEAAIKQAATLRMEDLIIVNQPNVVDLQNIAIITRDAIMETLEGAGLDPYRPLAASVAFITTDHTNVRVRVEPSAQLTDVDRVWISTPYYALAMSKSFIENNANTNLYITITSDVRDYRPFIPPQALFAETPWVSVPAAPAAIPTPQPTPAPNMDIDITAPPAWIFGTPFVGTRAPAVFGNAPMHHSREAYRTYTVTFSRPVSEPVRIAVPPSPGSDPTYQTLRGTCGANIGGRYNPATGNLEARVNQNGTFVVQNNRIDFTDIQDRSAEMQRAIRQLAAHGMMQGATPTEFRPDDTLTRAQMAALVVRMLAIYDASATNHFADVRGADWFYASVSTVYQAGLMAGTAVAAFAPNTNTSREQLLALAAQVLHVEMGYRFPTTPANFLIEFRDWQEISEALRPEVALSARENVPMLRADGHLRPLDDITRGEAALIFHRLYLRLW